MKDVLELAGFACFCVGVFKGTPWVAGGLAFMTALAAIQVAKSLF